MDKQNKGIIFIVIIIGFICCLLCGFFGQNNNNNNELQTFQQENVQNAIIMTEEENIEVIEKIDEEILYTTTGVNLRAGPSKKYKIIDVLSINTEVIKIGEENGGAKIKWSDTEIYYIYNKYLSIEKTVIMKKSNTSSRSGNHEDNNIIVKSNNNYQNYAYKLVLEYGGSDYDFECLVKLWTKESEWDPNCHNKSSGAHGIPQALPASKMASEGEDYYTNGYTQIRGGLKYIKNRYSSPEKAGNFWLNHHGY